jgi:hypothetical protein
MNALNKNGREEMRMWKAFLIILTFLLFMSYPVRADLVFDSGYNTYDESYGYNAEVWVINDAHLDVLSGSIGKLETQNYSTSNIYNGIFDWLTTVDNSIVNIYGGQFRIAEAFPYSTVNLYAYDTIYHTSGGINNEPWIEGIYLTSNEPFYFSFNDESNFLQFQIIPEPATMLLFYVGILFLKKKQPQ